MEAGIWAMEFGKGVERCLRNRRADGSMIYTSNSSRSCWVSKG